MDNLISILFLAFIIGIGFFLKNELVGKAHFKHIKKFIFLTYSAYVLLTAIFISKSIVDGVDTVLFGGFYGLFGALIWRVYKNEDHIAKLLMYYILLMPLRVTSNLLASWKDGFFSIIGTNALMHTVLLVAVLGLAIIKKHYLTKDLIRVVAYIDIVATVFLAIASARSLLRIPFQFIFLVALQLPFILLFRVLYMKFILEMDVEIKTDSVKAFVASIRLPWLSDRLDMLENKVSQNHQVFENESDPVNGEADGERAGKSSKAENEKEHGAEENSKNNTEEKSNN